MEITSILILIAFGVFGGFLSGLLGVGGGIIFIPILSYFLKAYDLENEEFVRYILANSFATMFFAGIVSTYKQYKLQSFYPKQIGATAITAMASSTLVTYFIATKSWYSKEAFSILFLSLLVFTVIRFVFKAHGVSKDVKDTDLSKYSILGFLTGIVTALSGLGGGIVMIPLFNQYVKVDMKSASSISIGVIPLILIPVLISYGLAEPTNHVLNSQYGYILPSLFLPMVAGLVFAAPIGVASSRKISDKRLKIIFAVLVLIVIVNTIVNLIS